MPTLSLDSEGGGEDDDMEFFFRSLPIKPVTLQVVFKLVWMPHAIVTPTNPQFAFYLLLNVMSLRDSYPR